MIIVAFANRPTIGRVPKYDIKIGSTREIPGGTIGGGKGINGCTNGETKG